MNKRDLWLLGYWLPVSVHLWCLPAAAPASGGRVPSSDRPSEVCPGSCLPSVCSLAAESGTSSLYSLDSLTKRDVLLNWFKNLEHIRHCHIKLHQQLLQGRIITGNRFSLLFAFPIWMIKKQKHQKHLISHRLFCQTLVGVAEVLVGWTCLRYCLRHVWMAKVTTAFVSNTSFICLCSCKSGLSSKAAFSSAIR